MHKIIFATSNPDKLEELKAICKNLSDIEFILPPKGFAPLENGSTFEENSLIKAREAARIGKLPALADDSGLCVAAIDGAPGIHSARYAETPQKRIEKLLNVMKNEKDRTAKFVCSMTLVDSEGNILCQKTDECCGKIGYECKGTHGFGYDPIFVVGEKGTTMAELDEHEKNSISHRAKALKQIIFYLNSHQMS